jgi:hypothetical protein
MPPIADRRFPDVWNSQVIQVSPLGLEGLQTLLDYLEASESIDDFLEGFPSVTRAQVITFLEQAKDRLIASAS